MTTPHDARPVGWAQVDANGDVWQIKFSGPTKTCNIALYTATDYDALRSEVERLQSGLQDPQVVHALMLKGVIAKPSWRSIVHLMGEVPNGEEQQLARIAELQHRAEAAEARIEAMSDYRTHHHDWRRACVIAAAYANDQADVDYWHHQIKTLDALNAQGDEGNG